MTTKKQETNTAIVKSETGAIIQYGEWTEEQMGKEDKEMSSGGDFWKVPVGSTVVRFLPPKLGWSSPFVIQHQHFIRMPAIDHPIVFCCPRLHEGKPCMACQKADKLETSGNSLDAKKARKIRASKRMAANVIIDPTDSTAKVSIWAFGVTVYNQLTAIRKTGGNFLDPLKGFDITVQRKGTGQNDTEYTLIASRKDSPLINMEWIEMQRDLRKLVRVPTLEQQQRLFDGEDPRDVWGDSGDTRSSSGRKDVIDVDANTRTAEDDLFENEIEID